MSMFSAALGAGAGAVADQAKGLIDQETKTNAEKELMAAREQMQLRLNEAQEQTRRAGRQADVNQDIENEPRVSGSKANAERTVGGARNEVAAAGESLKAETQRNEELAGAQFDAKHPELSAHRRGVAADKEPPGQSELRQAQAQYYRGGGAAGARAAAGGSKDDEKTALATIDRLNKTAKGFEDSGDIEAAKGLRAHAQQLLEGINSRQADKGKGEAPKTYPAVPAAHAALLNKRLQEKPKDAALIISAFEKTYGPGSADALIE